MARSSSRPVSANRATRRLRAHGGGCRELLGAHNDAASAEHFLSLPHAGEAARAAGVVSGWFARGVIIADENLAKEWKRFRGMRPFWR